MEEKRKITTSVDWHAQHTRICVYVCVFFFVAAEKGVVKLWRCHFFRQTDILEPHSTWNNESFRTKREQLKRKRAYAILYCIHATSRTLAILDNSKLSRRVVSRYSVYVCVGVCVQNFALVIIVKYSSSNFSAGFTACTGSFNFKGTSTLYHDWSTMF